MDLTEIEREFRAQGSTVLEKLRQWASEKGDATCLYYGDGDLSLTWEEFERLTNRAAGGFAALGVGTGERISVLSRNAFVTTVAMFGAWKIGAVYAPVNNAYKGELLAYILNDTGPKLLVLDQAFVGELGHISGWISHMPRIVVHEPKPGAHDHDAAAVRSELDFDAISFERLLDAPDTDPGVPVLETDLANIIYTSGTTGQPKGVVQSHGWMHGYIAGTLPMLHPDDVLYNDLPMYHVGGACFNAVRAVWAGCKLAMWDRFSSGAFWDRMRKGGVTHATLMGVMIDWLMNAPASEQDREHPLKMVSMNPLPANHHEVARRFGIDFVGAGYGSTELGVGFGVLIDELGDELPKSPEWQKGYTRDEIRAMQRELSSEPEKSLVSGRQPLRKGIMGLPSPLVDVKVVDEAGNIVPPNVPGQAAFRHKLPNMLFREYFNKPDAMAEAVRDGWYYPSDVISYDENGIYYFEDRKQGFIRVRGENLSATTVEHLLGQHPAVGSIAVAGVPARQGDEEDVAAFIVLKADANLAEEEMRAWADKELPKFMRPRHIRFVTELPVTPTFKIERYKLTEMIAKELER